MMMLQEVLCEMKDRVLNSGYVNQFYELCEMVDNGNSVQPQYYVGAGQTQPVYNFDVGGAGYVRKMGAIEIDINPKTFELTACVTSDNQILDVLFPLRAVFAVPKKKLGDDAFADERIFNEMIGVIDTDYQATDVMEVKMQVKRCYTDGLQIYREEVEGSDHQVNFELSYIAIDFDLIFTVKKGCLAVACSYG